MAICRLCFIQSCKPRSSRRTRRRLAAVPAVRAPTAIDPLVLSRLNAALDLDARQAARTVRISPVQPDTAHEDTLQELGRDLRRWRLRHGCTRAILASRLPITLAQLLCLENGITQPGDLTAGQVFCIKALLAS